MAEAVYGLCALTSILCALLLLRGYRSARSSLLFWACLCFAGLALNNIIMFADLVMLPDTDLGILRSAVSVVSMALLVFGLVGSEGGQS